MPSSPRLRCFNCCAVLRRAATGGRLGLLHADDWPEVRLLRTPVQFGAGSRNLLSTLPPAACAATSTLPHEHSRLFDYRCHAPSGVLGTAFPRRLKSCLAELAASEASAIKMAEALGASDGDKRAALARAARLLLDYGMEAAIDSRHPEALRKPPCCTAAECAQAATSWFSARSSPPPPPPLPPPEGDPRHPRGFGLLEPSSSAHHDGAPRGLRMLLRRMRRRRCCLTVW